MAVLHGRREIGHFFLNVGLFVRDALLSVLEHLVLGGQILDGVGLVRDDLSSQDRTVISCSTVQSATRNGNEISDYTKYIGASCKFKYAQ